MSDNRGKTIEDCVVEREAEYAWLKHLTDPADIKRCRQRITHLGNRIQKLNEKGGEGIEAATPATPSDPHSAEAEEREAWAAFVAGHASRDAEVAELRAEKERWHDAALIGLAQGLAAQAEVEVAELKAKIAGRAKAALPADPDKLTPVYVLAWDGEISMSGLPHRASGGEFASFDNARDAAKRARIDRKPGFRIERRYVTEWEVVPHV